MGNGRGGSAGGIATSVFICMPERATAVVGAGNRGGADSMVENCVLRCPCARLLLSLPICRTSNR